MRTYQIQYDKKILTETPTQEEEQAFQTELTTIPTHTVGKSLIEALSKAQSIELKYLEVVGLTVSNPVRLV